MENLEYKHAKIKGDEAEAEGVNRIVSERRL